MESSSEVSKRNNSDGIFWFGIVLWRLRITEWRWLNCVIRLHF